MFSLFPSQWMQPVPMGLKPIKSLDPNFPPRTVMTSKPVPASVPEPIKVPVKIQIPESEMCIGENNDFSEVDRMLSELDNPTPESRAEQILQMIKTINEQLEKNIKIIQDVPSYEQDTVSREDLLKLLQMFFEYSKTIENYIKEKKPSSL